MAALIESITVPRSSPLLTNPSAPVISSSSISASYGSRKSTSYFPGFKGLKIQSPRRTLASSGGFRNHSVIRRQGIVCEAQETALQVPSVTDSSWKTEVLDSDLPVLVEFWAPWCGPCRMIHPVVGELSKEFTGKLKCFNLNTDESPTIATEYGIRSIPTIIIFKNGEKKDAIIGAVPKTTLTATIEKFL